MTYTTLNDCDLDISLFSGTIPESFGKLVNLTDLDLSRNRLTGDVCTPISYTTVN